MLLARKASIALTVAAVVARYGGLLARRFAIMLPFVALGVCSNRYLARGACIFQSIIHLLAGFFLLFLRALFKGVS